MSNLIDRQAAIDALCSECQGRCIPCKYYPCSEVKAINALPYAQPEPSWIPTAKRLPEIKQRVLITYNTEDGLKTDVTWYDTYGFMLSENVTAWMPMVEPYRAERRTDERAD